MSRNVARDKVDGRKSTQGHIHGHGCKARLSPDMRDILPGLWADDAEAVVYLFGCPGCDSLIAVS